MKKAKCGHCGEQFLSKNLAQHTKRKHPNMQVIRDYSDLLPTPSQVKCFFCDKVLNKSNIKRHMRGAHKMGTKRRYKKLPNVFNLKTRQMTEQIKILKKHIKEGHQKGQDQSNNEILLDKMIQIKKILKTSGRGGWYPRQYEQLRQFINQQNLSHLFQK